MSTEAQIAANQANAQHSTGPTTKDGKAASCQNNFRWGFCGAFTLLASEDEEEYHSLVTALRAEHKPSTVTETILVEKMGQHHWLGRRAINLQNVTMELEDMPLRDKERQFSLFMRYQTTNDRAFHKCLNDLLKLRAEKRRTEIGFERQRQREAEEARKEAVEKRKQDLHRMSVLLAEAKADHQIQLNSQLEHSMRMASFRENPAVMEQKAA